MKTRAKRVAEIICIYWLFFVLELFIIKILQYHLPLPKQEIEDMLPIILSILNWIYFS